MSKVPQAKILLLDVETAPAEAYVWGIYDQNINYNQIKHHAYMLCWSAKWSHEAKVMSDCLINHPTHFKENKRSDKRICESIWKLMNEADIIIGHNGDEFDLKRLNSYFLKNKMKPVSPYKSIDTLKALRSNFGFLSNKLDSICQELKIGAKVKHEGFELWIKCMAGDPAAFGRMVKYNKKDVLLLQELYETIKPFIKNHPSMNIYSGNVNSCINCGSESFKREGYSYTATSKYQRYQCLKCGKFFRDTKNLLVKNMVRSA